MAEGRLAPGVLAPEAWPDAAAFLGDLLADEGVRILHRRGGEPARPLEIVDL